MTTELKTRNTDPTGHFVDCIRKNQEKIISWLYAKECCHELPLYSSMDIRDAGFKAAVVDTNLFPAGFNNLCEHGLVDAQKFIREAINRRVSGCRDILIVAEEHMRNTWYLENIRILEDVIRQAGYNVHIATFLAIQPDFCTNARYVELETATGQPVRIHCFKRILSDYESDRQNIDLIILNNDLTTGIPEILKKSKIPIYPSIQAGWHARLKSHHFQHTQELMIEFSQIMECDAWLLS
ncbi:MAG: glutamate--cysteine ligase, partial [Candidatus Omnitrophota bacterium]|nr:glutamate--cysteine ligase [Candidatus Omnitrophota bacterium]